MRNTRLFVLKYFLQSCVLNILYCQSLDQDEYSKISQKNVVSKDNWLSIANVEQTFNKSLVYRVEKRMYLDFGFIAQKSLYDSLKYRFSDASFFFKDIALELAEIFSWHNIEFSVKQLIIEEIDKDVFDYDSKNHNIVFNKLNNRSLEYTLDYYILYYNKLLNYTHNFIFDNFFCLHGSMHLQDITLSKNLNAKKIAEITAQDIIKLHIFESATDFNCECPYKLEELCISQEYDISNSYDNITKMFSECSVTPIYLNALNTRCLLEKDPRPRIYAKCGDGILDDGEQCDCGSEFICKMTEQDFCCNYNNCTYKNESFQCSHGSCCQNCQFKNGSICRESYGDCDSTESCNGLSFECPIDQVYDHYTMCNNGVGMCINGMCSSFDSLCKYVYKKESVYFDDSCYDYLITDFRSNCESSIIPEDLKYMCNKIDKCKNFICAVKNVLVLPYVVTLRIGYKYCLFPREFSLVGFFKQSPSYLRCGDNNQDYCFNSTCNSDRISLPICDEGYCKAIDNSIQYIMDKKLYIIPELIPLWSYNYGIYLYTLKKVVIKKIKPSISIFLMSIAIALVSILIFIFVFTRKILPCFHKAISCINKTINYPNIQELFDNL